MRDNYKFSEGRRGAVVKEDAEDLLDIAKSANEESFPQEFVEKLINSDAPLSVWREYRGMTQKDLETASGVGQGYIAQIETGKKTGSVDTLRKLTKALNVDIDDLVVSHQAEK